MAKISHCNIKKFIFKKRYAPLWQILSGVGKSEYIQYGATMDFPEQPSATSKLLGTPFLTDPSSPAPVKILAFDLKNIDGPITNIQNKFIINTYNDAVKYKISYKINIPHRHNSNIKIGFYTSNTFRLNQENKLTLITGSKGPSLFNANKCNNFSGSFICQFISYIYVAVDANVDVQLKIRTIIPEIVIIPNITFDRPHISYIEPLLSLETKEGWLPEKCSTFPRVELNCKKIPVAITKVKPGLILSTKPTHDFKKISKFINKYLNDTALTIILFEPTVSTQSIYPKIYSFGNNTPNGIGFRSFNPFSDPPLNPFLFIDTRNIPERTYYDFGSYTGLKLIPPASPTPGNLFYRISFESSVNVIDFPQEYGIIAGIRKIQSGKWGGELFRTADEFGRPIGVSQIDFGMHLPFNVIPISGSFLIFSGDAPDFTFFIEYTNATTLTSPKIRTPFINLGVEVVIIPS